ncbi:MAG: glycosyltransferase family 4 protein [Anaeromyxobacter sp.]
MNDRLKILHVSMMPSSPPRFGAQARMHGLLVELAKRHDVTALALHDDGFDVEEARAAMGAYCREVVLVPNPNGQAGLVKRTLQLRSIASPRSYERLRHEIPGLQAVIDRLMTATAFDVVNLEFPYLAHYDYRRAPPGAPLPPTVVDAHDIAWDIVRQVSVNPKVSRGRRLYARLNWPKLKREETGVFRAADATAVCSDLDRARLLADVPGARVKVIPNAADVEFYRPRPEDPPPDGRTVLFFGLLNTMPNMDGIAHFVQDVWPHVLARRPDARFKIVGKNPPPHVAALAGPSIELTGFVDDLRPHLSAASAIVVPLRMGSGTRLKILEAMAQGKGIVSTRLGAEGIGVEPGRHLLVEDAPEAFAAEVVRLLDDPALGARLGAAARDLAVERYAWGAAAQALEELYREVILARRNGMNGKGGRS